MKKFIGSVALAAMFVFTLSSFTGAEKLSEVVSSCSQNAVEYGEFMAGFDGQSGAQYAVDYYETFCVDPS